MIENRTYSMAIHLGAEFSVARERVVEALQKEGFGVITEIDVKETLKKKLDVDWRPYAILGACSPPVAHQALLHEADMGVLMPCNVVVYANDAGGCTVASIDPEVQFGKVQNPAVAPLAREVKARLQRVLESLG